MINLTVFPADGTMEWDLENVAGVRVEGAWLVVDYLDGSTAFIPASAVAEVTTRPGPQQGRIK